MSSKYIFLFLIYYLNLQCSSFAQIGNSEIKTNKILEAYKTDKYALKLSANSSSNRVLITYIKRADANLYLQKSDTIDLRFKFLIYHEIVNFESGEIEFQKTNNLPLRIDEHEFKNSTLSYFGLKYKAFDDTLFISHDSILILSLGKKFKISSSIRDFYSINLPAPIEGKIVSAKSITAWIDSTGSIQYMQGIKTFETLKLNEYNPDYLYLKNYKKYGLLKFTQPLNFVSLEFHTNFLNSQKSIQIINSFSFTYGKSYFYPLIKQLYYNLGIAYVFQNTKIKPSYVSDNFYDQLKNQEIKSHAILGQFGLTKTQDKSEKNYIQIIFWSSYAPLTRFYNKDINDNKERIQDDDFINRFNYGFKLQVGRENLSFFVNYGLSPLFKPSFNLTRIQTFSLGIDYQLHLTSRAGRKRGDKSMIKDYHLFIN